jgi:hypothetical protein
VDELLFLNCDGIVELWWNCGENVVDCGMNVKLSHNSLWYCCGFMKLWWQMLQYTHV